MKNFKLYKATMLISAMALILVLWTKVSALAQSVVLQKETFAQGCGLDEPRGLRFGYDDNLYVTSRDGIYRINATDHPGECMGKFNHGDPPTVPCPGNPQILCNPQLLFPSDLVFYDPRTDPPTGKLFVADGMHKRVVSYNAYTGEYIDELIAGMDAGPNGYVYPGNLEIGPDIISPLPYPPWKTFSPGYLFLSHIYQVLSIDSFVPETGEFYKRSVELGFIGSGSPVSLFYDFVFAGYKLYTLTDYTDTSGERWYVVDRYEMNLATLPEYGNYTYSNRFISLPTLPNQLCLPGNHPDPTLVPLSCSLDSLNALALGPDGNLYIKGGYDGGSTYILRFNGMTGEAMDNFAWVWDDELQYSYGSMIWGPDGKLYVVNRSGNKIRRYWEELVTTCPDSDGDNICDIDDNCPNDPNPGQIDYDGDGIGDVCDDSDGDGVVDSSDNCRDTVNDQADVDGDGFGDACDPDIDNDNIPNASDPCPYSDLNDFDGDHICDNVDPCLNDAINDPDGDSLCAYEDNCPYDYNPSQDDSSDFDGIGDACDPCLNDKYNDIDGDGLCTKDDNCPTFANAGQDDVDQDGIGDACDCWDVLQGPNENGIDCGGSACGGSPCVDCSWCGDFVTPIRVTGQPNADNIDVVFIPERSYQGNMSKFINDAIRHIRSGFFTMGEAAIDPLPAGYADYFNFYYYTGGFGKTDDCAGKVPGVCIGPPWDCFWIRAPFTDSAAILFNGFGQGCASGLGPTSHFIAEDNTHVVMHEAGHSIFGLVDEYCGDTYYTEPDVAPNVWDSISNCRSYATNSGWILGNCRRIQNTSGCQKDYWRYDPDTPDPDFMTVCGSGCTANYRWYEADTRRINYVFDNWRRMSSKGILSALNINNGTITEINSTVVDSHPDVGLQEGPFMLEALSSGNDILDAFKIWDPRIQIGAQGIGPGMIHKDNVDFIVIIPFYEENLKSFRIKDKKTGETLVTVDLTETLRSYCEDDNYSGPECQSLDLDNDGISETEDNCPDVANTDQADADDDGIGNACDYCPNDPNNDADSDKVCDDVDNCLGTNMGEVVDLNGCAINQLCPCENSLKNHGKYVSCVAKTAGSFMDEGLISGKEKGLIVSEAANSDCGKNK